ncbi:MAG: hypothetical protein ABMA64_08365 [Myxococcota bacterium]
MNGSPDIDFRQIAPRGGSRDRAFEELCCQLALAESGDSPSFRRVRGDGGDGGVECLWTDTDGVVRAWQVKYIFDLGAALEKAARSLTSARKNYPDLRHYAVCLPFDLAGSKGRRGKSEQQKFNTFREEQERVPSAAGQPITIELVSASLLRDRLLRIDASGGRRRFWFDDGLLGADWFATHLSDAFRRAGPRYRPELHHGHALDEALAALGDTSAWRETREAWWRRIQRHLRPWTLVITTKPSDTWVGPIPGAARESAESLLRTLHSVLEALSPDATDSDIATPAQVAHALALQCEGELAAALDERHGAGAADSPTFRHRESELHGHVPAAHLDECRELRADLAALVEWTASPAIRAHAERALLLVGPAGIGKTHGLCDGAARRRAVGQPTVLVAGAQLGGERSLGESLVGALGLGATWAHDQMLDALDAAGFASSERTLLIIDAMDERADRARWWDDLPVLVAAVKQRPHLALCVSVRDAYQRQLIRSDLDVPTLVHPGFGEAVFDACTAFFRFHHLDPPVGPLLEPELGNPLFLRVVCETLRELGLSALPAGWSGIRQMLDRLLQARDERLRQEHPGVGAGAVTRAMSALAAALPEGGAVAWSTADEIVTGTLPASQRSRVELLVHLVALGLARCAPVDGGEDEVDIAFGRLRHHLLADRYTQPGASSNDSLRRLALDDPGLAEALALVMPERVRGELVDLASMPWEGHDLTLAWLAALPWRGASTLSARCEELLRGALAESGTVYEALGALLTLAMRPGHRLDHHFLHALLAEQAMPARDRMWCGYVYDAFERSSPPSPLFRLLSAPWDSPPVPLPRRLLEAWLVVLGWCGAAADLRVRDAATKTAVRLSEPDPGVWELVIERFADVDDDAVLERILCAAYGTLLRNPVLGPLAAVANVVRSRVLLRTSGTPSHALVRDFSRCIGEWASHRGVLPPGVPLTEFQPPHARPIRFQIPTEDDLEIFADDRDYPRLYASVMSEWTGDFAKYTMPYVLRAYEKLLPPEEARRLLLAMAMGLGYSPDLHAAYDHEMLRTYGYGRGRPAWAERIGKKYQRIALGRLVGLLDDLARARGLAVPGLAGASLRDTDPSLLQRESVEPRVADGKARWWSLVSWSFTETEPRSDDSGIGGEDYPDPAALVAPLVDPACPERRWRLLGGHFAWDARALGDDAVPYREIWMIVTGYLVPRRQRNACWTALKDADFMGHWMPDGGQEDGRLFAGEYPWSPSFPEIRTTPDAWDERAKRLQQLGLRPVLGRLNGPEDTWQQGTISIEAPSVELAEATRTRWDGTSGFRDESGCVLFRDPSVTGGGPRGLWADYEALSETIDRLEADLIWTVLAKRQVVNRDLGDRFQGEKHVSWTMRQSRGRVVVRRTGGEHIHADRSRSGMSPPTPEEALTSKAPARVAEVSDGWVEGGALTQTPDGETGR